MLAYCDNTGEPLAGMLRPSSAGSNTVADRLAVLDAAITALPPGFRRQLMATRPASRAIVIPEPRNNADKRPNPTPPAQVSRSVNHRG